MDQAESAHIRHFGEAKITWLKEKKGKNQLFFQGYSKAETLNDAISLGANWTHLGYDFKANYFSFDDPSVQDTLKAAEARRHVETRANKHRAFRVSRRPSAALLSLSDILTDIYVSYTSPIPPSEEEFVAKSSASAANVYVSSVKANRGFTYYHGFCGLNAPYYGFASTGGKCTGGNDSNP